MSSLVLSLMLPLVSVASVTPQQANQLGKNLTPMGAEKAGNASGSIPAWTGGIQKPIAGFVPGEFHPNPYKNEKPRFVITSANWQKHKDMLSQGQIDLISKYPSYSINVYPSHRSAAYPQFVYDAVKKNAVTAQLQEYGSGVLHTIMASPFPIPQNGAEVLWNHTLRYRGLRWEYVSSTLNTTSSGDKNITTREYSYYFAYSEPGVSLEEIENKIFYLKRKTLSPAKLSGQMTLVHETLDQIRSPRKSWIYMPGQRRVRRTPDLAYDTSDIDSNGIRTIDQVDMFNGAPNLYDWNLIGKEEKYIPYNAYELHQGNLKINDIAGSHHINPNLVRYEPHRVWVVEATLRTGMSHIYHKRRYYFDEDTWQIVLAEEYNEDGKLIQYTEAHVINFYDVPMVYATLEVTYDLEQGRYFVEGLDNERKPMNFDVDFSRSEFTSSAMRRESK